MEKIKLKLSRRRIISLAIAIITLVVIVTVLATIFSEPAKKPNQLAVEGINNTLTATSYYYTSQSTLHIGSESQVYSNIEGYYAGNAHHAWGTILNSKVDVYQIENTLYIQDSLTGSWQKIENNDFETTASLFAEINPTSNLQITEIGECTYDKKEKINGTNCQIIYCKPTLANEWIEEYFKDIKYTLWVSCNNPRIMQAKITGTTSYGNTSGTLEIIINFDEYGKDFKITAPI